MAKVNKLLGVVYVLVLLSAAACGGGGGDDDGDGGSQGATDGQEQSETSTDRPATARAVAIQPPDLPKTFKLCTYSGEMDTYIRNLKDLNPATYESVTATWSKLKGAGATGGYAAYYGDSDNACRNLILPPEQRDFGSEEEHVRNHPKMVFSYVIQFADQAAAEAAYEADIFGQSQLRDQPAMDVAEGTPTRLGRNSIVAANKGSPIPNRQAVWQAKSFNMFFGSTALDRQASETMTTAMNARIH